MRKLNTSFYSLWAAGFCLLLLTACSSSDDEQIAEFLGSLSIENVETSGATLVWSDFEGDEISVVISATAEVPTSCFASISLENDGEYDLTALEPGTDYSVLACLDGEPTEASATFSTTASGVEGGSLIALPEELGSSLAFGSSLAVYDKTLAIGTPTENTVLMYEFDSESSAWQYDEAIENNLPGSFFINDSAGFGFSVDVSSDKLLVGAPFAEDEAEENTDGRVFYYKKSGDTWMEQQEIEDAELFDQLGVSLSMDGDRFATTSLTEGTSAVSVYQYSDSTDMWAKDQSFDTSTEGASEFINQVSLSGDRLAVTDYNSEDAFDSQVKVYHKDDSWTLEDSLTARLGNEEEDFGFFLGGFVAFHPIALERDQLIVSRQTDGESPAGFDYYVLDPEQGWDLAQTYNHPNSTALETYFGSNVDLSGDSLLVTGFTAFEGGPPTDDEAPTQIAYFKRADGSWNLENSYELVGLPNSVDVIYPSATAKLWGDMILGFAANIDQEEDVANCLTVYATDFDGTFDPGATCESVE